ncbi:MAG: IS3 family transposase [Sphingomonadales bacterium]|nr:IS3 family transposase [Sphingomonadales bacterium]
MKYEFIHAHRTQFGIYRMCRVLEVSRSGYYSWIDRPESARAIRHRDLTEKIRSIHQRTKRIYGSPRIHRELKDLGEVVGKNTVALLMRRRGIQSRVHRRFVVTTNSRHNQPVAPNRLERDFKAVRANEKWVSDVTGIVTRRGWLYLATVMDLYSRKLVGWSMSNRNSTRLVSDALVMAIAQRGEVKGVVLHSDRGKPYVSREYQQLMRDHGIVCSMSRKSDCWDNAPMESFYHSLKTEWVVFEDYRNHDEARASIFSYIELFYNRKRRHSALNYLSPDNYEQHTCNH